MAAADRVGGSMTDARHGPAFAAGARRRRIMVRGADRVRDGRRDYLMPMRSVAVAT